MKKILIFSLVVLRLFIVGKILFLLYKTQVDSVNYPLDSLTWWIYYLIFDMWIVITFKTPELTEND